MIDAMKQAMYLIDAWQRGANADEYFMEIAALRQAIAEAEKPVAKVVLTDTIGLPLLQWLDLDRQFDFKGGEFLYTAPPKQESEQEPFAWVAQDVCEGQFMRGTMLPRKIWWECEKNIGFPIYTAPVKPENELDIAERAYFAGKQAGIAEGEAISKLKEKNT